MKTAIASWKRKAANYQELEKQKGVTLLEIIIVLGIIGIIAAGVVILAQRAFAAQDTTAVADNTNTIRTSMNDVYRNSGYPTVATDYASPKALTQSTLRTATVKNPIVTLTKMGKLSATEAFNAYTKEPFQLVPASLDGTAATSGKGFVVAVTGMSSDQCRALASQVGSDWDYVETRTGFGAGKDFPVTAINLSANTAAAIAKTLKGNIMTPSYIVDSMCTSTGNDNALVLGSR